MRTRPESAGPETKHSHRRGPLGGALGWSQAPREGGRHHAARDENYLIEMFSFIYYSVSRDVISRAAKREGEDAEARSLCGEIGLDVPTGFVRAREKESATSSLGLNGLVAFIEKLSRSIAASASDGLSDVLKLLFTKIPVFCIIYIYIYSFIIKKCLR